MRTNRITHIISTLGVGLFTSLVLAGCPQRSAVWIEEGSTASRLVFGIGKEKGRAGGADIGVVRVYRCDGPSTGPGANWVVGPQGGTGDVAHLVYGVTPPGFVSDQGPEPLQPGCYKVDVSGSGKTEFLIDPAGGVTERKRGA